jgi:hypothetical protein
MPGLYAVKYVRYNNQDSERVSKSHEVQFASVWYKMYQYHMTVPWITAPRLRDLY